MKTRVIAEIGCNHKGDMEIAKEMIIVAAKFAKADVVKFQKRCNKDLLTEEEYNKWLEEAKIKFAKEDLNKNIKIAKQIKGIK